MLEEGKITSEEAIELMEALDEVEIPKKPIELDEDKSKSNPKRHSKQIFETLEDIGNDIGNALEDIGNEFGSTFSKMFDGLKDVGTNFNFKGNYETVVTDLDMDLSNVENPSLDLRAVNGNIKLKPIDGDKVIIKSTCQYKNDILDADEPYYDFYMDNNKLIFNPKYNSGISIKLDVCFPRKDYDQIVLNSTNGKIDLEELNIDALICTTTNSSIDIVEVSAKEMDLTTKNGRIECKNVNCSNSFKAYTTNSNVLLAYVYSPDIDIKTANAKIRINNISSDKVSCKTSNSNIDASDIICDSIQLITSNGKVNLTKIDMSKAKEIKMITSNGSINSEIHKISKDISFDLETSMGNISLEIPDLVYKLNKQASLGFRKIIAHNVGFIEGNDYLKFVASTSNGSIKIS